MVAVLKNRLIILHRNHFGPTCINLFRLVPPSQLFTHCGCGLVSNLQSPTVASEGLFTVPLLHEKSTTPFLVHQMPNHLWSWN
jgi:hypothetical protein